MMRSLLWRFFYFFEGGEGMMALLLAQQIMRGKLTYPEVPEFFKPQVKEILIDSGAEALIIEE